MSDESTERESEAPTSLTTRIPLEDMRELWYWGTWKEHTPRPFSTSVLIVCTSRNACRRYLRGQTHDYWLLDEDESHAKTASTGGDDDLCDDGTGGFDDRRRFRLLSHAELLEAVRCEHARHSGLTLLVNPRSRGNATIEADAMLDVDSLLREQRSADAT